SAWRAELSSYGQLRHLAGARAACPFRYQGQYEDAETGLYYNRFRYYDPHAGTYISQDPIGLEGGLEFYAYVPDPHKQVDLFGLSGTCPLAGRKSNAWNDFQAKTKGQFGSRAESLAEYRRLRAGTNPWPKDYVPTLEKAKIGERVHMAMGAGQPNTLPGAFATKDVIPDVAYVRDNLAVRSDFKKTVDYVQEYQVIKDIDVIRGPVGPQIDPAAGKYLPCGGGQVHF
ncbi:MAG: RHS repeat-associated core domain-containing protein, partial [Hymenobacter sp.]